MPLGLVLGLWPREDACQGPLHTGNIGYFDNKLQIDLSILHNTVMNMPDLVDQKDVEKVHEKLDKMVVQEKRRVVKCMIKCLVFM